MEKLSWQSFSCCTYFDDNCLLYSLASIENILLTTFLFSGARFFNSVVFFFLGASSFVY